MVRKPIVAGQFYPEHAAEIEKEIKESFNSKFGPGSLPSNKRGKSIIGIIAPHAGYTYSGAAAAWAYKEIGEAEIPDAYVILGLSHQGFGSCVSLEDWETPLGVVKNDKEFGLRLVKAGIKQSERAHALEHSIEVQIPFLQFVNKKDMDKIKIVPIIASPDVSYDEIAGRIVNVVKKLGRKVCVIASSDFTHYGVNYGYFPFSSDVKDNIYKLDKGAISYIEKLNPARLLHYADETGATICGKVPIAAALEVCKKLGALHGKLLKYYTSGDIAGDYSSAVGYGAVVIE